MKEQLQRLAQLHQLDTEYYEISRRREDIEEQVESIRGAVASLEADLAKQQEALAETSKLRRTQEAELKAKEEQIGKAKSKLAGVRNTREYMAAEREVESARKDSAMVEEQIISLIEAEEKGRSALPGRRPPPAREDRLSQLKAETDAETAKVLSEAADLARRMGEIETGRREQLDGLDRQLIARYDMIRKRLRGAAMAEVTDGVCSSCHINLPPQLFNTLCRATSLEQCPNCNRIIFWSGLLGDDGDAAGAEADATA